MLGATTMFDLCEGEGLDLLLTRVLNSGGDRFKAAILCAPYVDEVGLERVLRLARHRRRQFSVLLVTRPEAARTLAPLQGRPGVTLRVVPKLHAKVYGVLGHDPLDHEAVVTSANLTAAAMMKNLEVGVRLRGSRPEHVHLIERLLNRVKHP